MSFSIAFDKDEELELLLYKDMIYKDKMFYSEPIFKNYIHPIGTLLLMFLNTNFEDEIECSSFIYNFCFESLYYKKHPQKNNDINLSFITLKLSPKNFIKELKILAKEEQKTFIYVKNVFLKNLNLPYDEDKINSAELTDEDISLESSPEIEKFGKDFDNYFYEREVKRDNTLNYFRENFNDFYVKEKEKYDEKHAYMLQKRKEIIETYNHIEINSFIEDISLDFDMIRFILSGIDTIYYNVPYGFSSDDILSILALDFKEFKTTKRNVIRKCQNCGYYFIPSNLKETKYCNAEFEDTGKTCKQIGKELAYKKSLKEDKLLDMYRKRYMSLASSVSHYGTDSAIKRFEEYKKDGVIMKAKYLNKEISAEEFENWISSSKKQKSIY